LTEAGNARFPDTHAQLTIKLIGSVRQLFGEAGLDKLITQRERGKPQRVCAGVLGAGLAHAAAATGRRAR